MPEKTRAHISDLPIYVVLVGTVLASTALTNLNLETEKIAVVSLLSVLMFAILLGGLIWARSKAVDPFQLSLLGALSLLFAGTAASSTAALLTLCWDGGAWMVAALGILGLVLLVAGELPVEKSRS